MLRLVGDQAHGAGLGAGAKQGALGAGQHFDALQVRGVHVQVPGCEGDRLLVLIERHPGRGALNRRHRERRLLGGRAAHEKLVASGAASGRDHVGEVWDVLLKAVHAELVDVVAGHRLHGDRDVLRGLGALGGGYHNLFNGCGLRRNRARGAHGDGRQHGTVQLAALEFHKVSPQQNRLNLTRREFTSILPPKKGSAGGVEAKQSKHGICRRCASGRQGRSLAGASPSSYFDWEFECWEFE